MRSGRFDVISPLVLACRPCNRGENGKSARIPSLALLERLHTRNEYLINNHHPLKDTLIQQTGENEQSRRDFLQVNYRNAVATLIHTWEPEPNGPEDF